MSNSALRAAAADLAREADQLAFAAPITHTYNPLGYAWEGHQSYIDRYAGARARVLFVGMNPGPFGMAQTGVPFGEIAAVRDWMGITARIATPPEMHPKRPIQGFDCPRSEVSGRRLWGLMQERFGSAEGFFAEHFVLNYCPLVFMEATGRNRTPNQLPAAERARLFAICDRHLARATASLQPEWVVGIGKFAEQRARAALSVHDHTPQITTVLHPSPANPHANRGWSSAAVQQLTAAGIWE